MDEFELLALATAVAKKKAAATSTPSQLVVPTADMAGTPDASQFGDIAASQSQDSRETMAAFGRGIFDTSQSPSYAAMPEDWNPALKATYSKVLDPAGYLMSGAAAAWEGVTGLAGDVARSVGVPGAERMARDAAAMPEAFAGAPGTSVVARPRVKIRRDAPEAPVAPVTQAITDDTSRDFGVLVAKAAKGDKKAQQRLAEVAKVNPEAKAAADRLGIDLPADVFSDDFMTQSASGLTRSKAGSEAEAAWVQTVRNASEKADDAIATLGGGKDVSTVSDDVLRSAGATRQELADTAKGLYEQVNKKVGKPTRVGTPNVNKTLTEIMDEVGGADGLSSAEKKLLDAATADGGITYGRLLRTKQEIGAALAGKESTFGNVEQGALKRIYKALAEDQVQAARTVAGDDVAKMLIQANGLTTREKALGKSMVNAFGRDLEGSIANKLKLALNRASDGDVTQLNKVLDIVPEDMRSEAILTAIGAATKAKRTTGAVPAGGFGFSEFTKFYQGLRENSKAYSEVARHLTPEAKKVLADLYSVSSRVTNARARVLTTGKANQALLEGMTAESIVGKVLESTAGSAAATGAGAVAGGPAGAVAGQLVAKALASNKVDRLKAAGDMFRDERFNRMMAEATQTGQVSQKTAAQVAKSPKFRKWYATTDHATTDPVAWLMATVAGQQASAPAVGSEDRSPEPAQNP